MSGNSEKSIHDKTNQPQEGAGGAGMQSLRKSRKRDRFDTKGNLIITQGISIPEKLLFDYKRQALFQHTTVTKLIRRAMEAYKEAWRKSDEQRMAEAGQTTLPL